MSRTAAIFVGHSHLVSIIGALIDRPGESFSQNEGIEYFVFDTTRFGTDFQFSIADASGNYALNSALMLAIDEKVPRHYNRVFISMFGGNAHNALTLLEHPTPFDIILPEEPGRPRIPNAEVVPYRYIESFIRRLAEGYILNMTCLRNAYREPVVHIESPPPIGDNDFVLAHLEQYFLDQTRHPRVAPRELRYKLWRLHSKIIREAATAFGVDFLPAPAASVDPEGFLAREAYGSDSTHAGAAYGLHILKELEQKFSAAYGGWGWLY